ncbi:hypothetical protein [Cochlodiniinecator piscidefendens]|uniref:hypothetical protein n=1 Tax=Cochlodiniinecator piscidefendens TaxID=2715756 RepID=UPI00140806C0|nr:hypothetical protein [Cochlodiniinecator piscidefendens]
MVQEIWLHIGTAKSGTTALQHYYNENLSDLSAAGLKYITAPGHSSANKLAIAINKNREDELIKIGEHITREIETGPEQVALISSEMFFGMAPDKILSAVPILRDYPLNVLVYIRRQDRYIESKYLQKMKNGRFKGSIWDYIEKFQGSGSDYMAELRPWFNMECDVHPRICERSSLIGGSTVTDALDVMGFKTLAQNVPESRVENTSPSIGRIQLMQALGEAGHPKVRQIQRALPADPGGKARVLTQAERRAYLDKYADSNEDLRQDFFPSLSVLFATGDLETPEIDLPSGYSPAQISELTEVFKVLLQKE